MVLSMRVRDCTVLRGSSFAEVSRSGLRVKSWSSDLRSRCSISYCVERLLRECGHDVLCGNGQVEKGTERLTLPILARVLTVTFCPPTKSGFF